MATLQAARSGSATTARSRLKLVTGMHPAPAKANRKDAPLIADKLDSLENLSDLDGINLLEGVIGTDGTSPDAAGAARKDLSLTELEHRQLMIQAASLYSGWQLVSLQHRPENEVLVAYLVRADEAADPILAIREGRAMQLIMDGAGDLRLRRPRHYVQGLLTRLINWLTR